MYAQVARNHFAQYSIQILESTTNNIINFLYSVQIMIKLNLGRLNSRLQIKCYDHKSLNRSLSNDKSLVSFIENYSFSLSCLFG